MPRFFRRLLLVLLLCGVGGLSAQAARITIACSAVGMEYRLCKEGAHAWARKTGNTVALVQSPNLTTDRLALYVQMLAAQSSDVDVFQIDVIWPGILAPYLLNLQPLVPTDEITRHFPVLVDANTVNGELKALPWYTDVGLLFYRSDLLKAYNRPVPQTWQELQETAQLVMKGERAKGRRHFYGYVFQGKPYEGLTCNALEWIDSFHGGRILSDSGRVTFYNTSAVRALDMAAGWVGTIAPRGVLTYGEEESRGVFQAGHALFMRNWPYAWALANSRHSPVRGKVGVAALPAGGDDGHPTGTLGGWGLGVSRFSKHPELAVSLVRYLTGPDEQRRRAIVGAYNPTIPALYKDPAVLKADPFFAELPEILRHSVARPSAAAGRDYNRLSATVWEAAHDVLAGRAKAKDALSKAAQRLERILQRSQR
ncbi:MAG TPA: ABC transporter substrate-binding protein [bacterium]|nr:ABC transporter substrate-binding protein [bacterium]